MGAAMYEKDFRISYLFDYYGNALTDKRKDAIDLYYNEDLSLAEIAEHINITRQGVRDAIKHGEATLLELEEKLGFAGKLDAWKAAMEEIRKYAEAIKFSKNNINYYRILDESADGILNKIKDLIGE